MALRVRVTRSISAPTRSPASFTRAAPRVNTTAKPSFNNSKALTASHTLKFNQNAKMSFRVGKSTGNFVPTSKSAFSISPKQNFLAKQNVFSSSNNRILNAQPFTASHSFSFLTSTKHGKASSPVQFDAAKLTSSQRKQPVITVVLPQRNRSNMSRVVRRLGARRLLVIGGGLVVGYFLLFPLIKLVIYTAGLLALAGGGYYLYRSMGPKNSPLSSRFDDLESHIKKGTNSGPAGLLASIPILGSLLRPIMSEVFSMFQKVTKASEDVKEECLERLNRDPKITNILGSPITTDGRVESIENLIVNKKEAYKMRFSVVGPNGASGLVKAKATLSSSGNPELQDLSIETTQGKIHVESNFIDAEFRQL